MAIMAGDWIKMRGNLWDDPRVARLCDETNQGEAPIIGGLYWLWATADQHTEDGIMPGLTLRQIDRKTGIQGFGEALCLIGWLADHPDGVRIVRFSEHNGASAKRRCSESRRKMSARDADKQQTDCGTSEEERHQFCAPREREELTDTDVSVVDSSSLSPCPHQEILKLFSDHLPELPQPRVWNGARHNNLAARWKWVLSDLKRKGKPFGRDDGLSFFKRMFEYIGGCDLLMGRKGDWSADLGWIVRAENFAKIIEGNYQNKEAA